MLILRQDARDIVPRICATHDAISRFSFFLAALLVAVIAVSYSYEVVLRYFFNAPTEWVTPLVAYALCAMIFLAQPELTRRGEHIVVNLLSDRLTPDQVAKQQVAVNGVAAVFCVFAAWFTADATFDQWRQDVWTTPPFATPKWIVSMFVPYGMLSAAIYFLRHAIKARHELTQ